MKLSSRVGEKLKNKILTCSQGHLKLGEGLELKSKKGFIFIIQRKGPNSKPQEGFGFKT